MKKTTKCILSFENKVRTKVNPSAAKSGTVQIKLCNCTKAQKKVNTYLFSLWAVSSWREMNEPFAELVSHRFYLKNLIELLFDNYLTGLWQFLGLLLCSDFHKMRSNKRIKMTLNHNCNIQRSNSLCFFCSCGHGSISLWIKALLSTVLSNVTREYFQTQPMHRTSESAESVCNSVTFSPLSELSFFYCRMKSAF